ncbi:TfoX/Sxy family protein [Myxococcota bacterium]|nr:TfoX/Sxy family protein [Myxococcota bacterium]MBU1534025.1 TfoX/Sxy family protein [Myxococcota bacterium]
MAYSTLLQNRIEATGLVSDLAIKKMFGGICYLAGGKMALGVYQDFLILRLGVEDARDALLGSDHVLPFNITGKTMKGWVMVDPTGWQPEPSLIDYISRSIAFARTLSP